MPKPRIGTASAAKNCHRNIVQRSHSEWVGDGKGYRGDVVERKGVGYACLGDNLSLGGGPVSAEARCGNEGGVVVGDRLDPKVVDKGENDPVREKGCVKRHCRCPCCAR